MLNGNDKKIKSETSWSTYVTCKINIQFCLKSSFKKDDPPVNLLCFTLIYLVFFFYTFLNSNGFNECSLIGRSTEGGGGLQCLQLPPWLLTQTSREHNMQKEKKEKIKFYITWYYTYINMEVFHNVYLNVPSPFSSFDKFIDPRLIFTRLCRLIKWSY